MAEVKLANGKQLLKYTIYAGLTLLGVAAFICSMIFTGPTVPILFAIGAALWLVIDASKIHKKVGDLLIGKSDIPSPEIEPTKASEQLETELFSISNIGDALASTLKPLTDFGFGWTAFASPVESLSKRTV